tara:strand:- start:4169 stop:4528 length:360 start_codon:yes stop_codon:yes gene_type:complete
MSTNRYIDKLKAQLAKEIDKRMQFQALFENQVAGNRALLAERDAAQKDAERRVPLYEAIERACGELPDGWAIMLCAEHHAGTVELYGPDGSREEFPTNNERLDYTVIDALEHALQGEQP